MKNLLVLLIAIALVSPACKKSSSATYMNTATIKGPNYTMPACGAAYWITVHGVTDSNAQFNTLPAGSGIDLTTATFPINVKLNWHKEMPDNCNIIIVDAVIKAD